MTGVQDPTSDSFCLLMMRAERALAESQELGAVPGEAMRRSRELRAGSAKATVELHGRLRRFDEAARRPAESRTG
jgi:hypothetical protein